MLFIIASSIPDHEPAAIRSHKTDIAISFGDSFGQALATGYHFTRYFYGPPFNAARISFLSG